jgi:hypothetical protein
MAVTRPALRPMGVLACVIDGFCLVRLWWWFANQGGHYFFLILPMRHLTLSTSSSSTPRFLKPIVSKSRNSGTESTLQSQARSGSSLTATRLPFETVSTSSFATDSLSDVWEVQNSAELNLDDSELAFLGDEPAQEQPIVTAQEQPIVTAQEQPTVKAQERPTVTATPAKSTLPSTFTEVGPSLLKQFKAIPGDLQAATGRFQTYSTETKQRMHDIKDALKIYTKAEKGYRTAICDGDSAEAKFQMAAMKQHLYFASQEFGLLSSSIAAALAKGTGGSQKRRERMAAGLRAMQDQMDTTMAELDGNPAQPKAPAQKEPRAELLRTETRRHLVPRPPIAQPLSGAPAPDGTVKPDESADSLASSTPVTPTSHRRAEQKRPKASNRKPTKALPSLEVEKPISGKEAARLKRELKALKRDLAAAQRKRDADLTAAKHVSIGAELGKEFAALQRRIRSFQSGDYHLDETTQEQMKRVRLSLRKVMEADATPEDTAKANRASEHLRHARLNFSDVRDSVDTWLIKADHIDAFEAGTILRKMNAFLEHLEKAEQTRAGHPGQAEQ